MKVILLINICISIFCLYKFIFKENSGHASLNISYVKSISTVPQHTIKSNAVNSNASNARSNESKIKPSGTAGLPSSGKAVSSYHPWKIARHLRPKPSLWFDYASTELSSFGIDDINTIKRVAAIEQQFLESGRHRATSDSSRRAVIIDFYKEIAPVLGEELGAAYIGQCLPADWLRTVPGLDALESY
jgi:hypothetical protein